MIKIEMYGLLRFMITLCLRKDITEWSNFNISFEGGHFSFQIILMQITLGIACVVISSCMAVPYIRQYYKFKKELENIASSFSNCVNCKKEIPQGNFAFCPSCGHPIKK